MPEMKDTAAVHTRGLVDKDLAWDACGIEEKVERLRIELRNQRWRLEQAARNAERLQEHDHNAKGEIVVPLHPRRGQGEMAGMKDQLA